MHYLFQLPSNFTVVHVKHEYKAAPKCTYNKLCRNKFIFKINVGVANYSHFILPPSTIISFHIELVRNNVKTEHKTLKGFLSAKKIILKLNCIECDDEIIGRLINQLN